ncbi:MAG: hypothetical protein PHQ94_07440, partial [Syntrophomonas sp.]|nr:hypothetical protein [Syntrophomonas sp.]
VILDLQVPRDQREMGDLQVFRDLQDTRVPRVIPDQQVLRDQRAIWDILVPRGKKVIRVRPDHRGLQALQDSAAVPLRFPALPALLVNREQTARMGVQVKMGHPVLKEIREIRARLAVYATI